MSARYPNLGAALAEVGILKREKNLKLWSILRLELTYRGDGERGRELKTE